MARRIPWDNDRLSWHGHISLEPTEHGVRFWRPPYDRLDLFPSDVLQSRAAIPAGVRHTLRSDTTSLSGIFTSDDDIPPLDLVCDGVIQSSSTTPSCPSICIRSPKDTKLCRSIYYKTSHRLTSASTTKTVGQRKRAAQKNLTGENYGHADPLSAL